MTRLALSEARSDDAVRRRKLRWAQLKQARLPWEPLWRDISDYILPRRNQGALEVPGALNPRRMVDTTGSTANDRFAATLLGYLVSGFDEFMKPRLNEREPTYEESVWLDQVSRKMFLTLTSAKSNFRTQLAEGMVDSVAFGTSVMWTGARAKEGPRYLAVPINDCWIDDNPDTGQCDTLARRFSRRAWEVKEKYPDVPKIDKIAEDDPNREMFFVELIEPRKGGRAGKPVNRKPWSTVTFLDDETCFAVAASGYDEFPYAVSRFQRLSGQPYGYGPGVMALPMIKGLNVLVESFILQSEQAADPALIDMTGGALSELDTRPGSLNALDASIWRQYSNAPTMRVYEPGDLGPIMQLIEYMRTQVEVIYFVDWLRHGGGPQQTATEWADRRDQTLRGLGPAVARLEQESLNPVAERTYTLMQRAGEFGPPPESLVGLNLSFEYKSPIATTQRQVAVEGLMRLLEFTRGAVAVEAEAKQSQSAAGGALNLPSIVRAAGQAYGVSPSLLTDPRVIAANKAEAESAAQLNQALEQAGAAAGAAQQASQALSTGAL
ncbi:portal protein [Parvularcula sp. LCG005]|uniref:portal protein n=1 Tax=Parvularcula sp. LCG005 TaxID=3078805 RepID=UPI0029431A39|nr:portal protein [Parvularcula sp. LCG005]WOI54310.1 portal protein [Parvularcula sp. LCG005]